MKYCIFTFFILFSFITNAQKFSHSFSEVVISSLQAKDAGGNAITKTNITEDYVIEAIKKDDDKIEITLKSTNDKEEEFIVHPLSFELFKGKFKKYYKKILTSAESIIIDNSTTFNEAQLSILYAKIITFERTENERPVVANITLNDDIPVKLFKKDGTEVIKTAKDVKLELTFYNGFIEKAELETVIQGEKIRFSNIYSIGISSSKGIRKFHNHKLLSFYNYTWDGTDLIRAHDSVDDSYRIEINFADIIDYDREIDINANDISPKPIKILLESELDRTKKATLYKEESTKLFEGVIFSDFLGVFDEENPNGIIQTEVAKKIFINTNRYDVTNDGKWLGLLFFPVAFSEGYGFFEYIDFSARISKLEENNKYLTPETIGTEEYFSPLRIKQHESFSIGTDLNILYLENQNKKIDTNLDFGLRYGRSGLQLEENKQDFFNTMTFSALLNFKFTPEKRYGFTISNRLSYFQIFNDDNLEIKSLKDNLLVKPNLWFNTSQIQFFINTSSIGKLFIRYNFVTELKDWDNNFSQFQFGYSFYILKQNGKLK